MLLVIWVTFATRSVAVTFAASADGLESLSLTTVDGLELEEDGERTYVEPASEIEDDGEIEEEEDGMGESESELGS